MRDIINLNRDLNRYKGEGMSSLTRKNIDALVKSHGLRAGYELKIMGKDDVIKGVQFASSFSSDVAGLPSKRSIVNDDTALNKLEKELLINFGKQNRRDAAERIVKNFKSTTERYLLPEGTNVNIQSLETETPTLKIAQNGNELASLTLDDWSAFSNSNNRQKYINQSEMLKIAQQHGQHLRIAGNSNNLSAIESTLNRFVIPDGVNVSVVPDHGAHHSVLIPGVTTDLKTYEPDFESKFEQAMLSIGVDKHAVELEFSLPLGWSDQSDEDGYRFEPSLADEQLIDEINDSIKIEVVNAIIGDSNLDENVIGANIDVRMDVASEAEIEDVDFDDRVPSNVRLRHQTVDDMPGASQEFSVQILMPPEFPASSETLGLIKDSVKELLTNDYDVSDVAISIKQSTKGMPLRGLKDDLKVAFEQALSQYSILEPEQKSNKLNDVVKSVIGYTAPVIGVQDLKSGSNGADAGKLASIVECSIEGNMLSELASPNALGLKVEEKLTEKLEQGIDNDVHSRPTIKAY